KPLLALFALLALAAAAPTELRFADAPFHLALSLGDMTPFEGAPSTADRKVFSYSQGTTDLSVIVENAHAPAVMESCRDLFQRRKEGMQPANEVQGQRGDAATQEFDMPLEFQGKPIVQHNIFSCRVRGTWYIDTHASKMGYAPGDHDALMAIVDGVKIVDGA